MPATIAIAGHSIGQGHPCFIIAEAGVNHNGSLELARQLIDVAVQAGADAVKFQTFKAEHFITPSAAKAAYQHATTGTKESQLEMIKRLELPFDGFRELFTYCQSKNILFLSTAFDEESADFLDSLGMAAFKVPSGEITNLPFLAHIARKGKPMIVSTGMSYLSEVEAGVQAIVKAGNSEFALLHCASNYPAEPADANLRAMHTLSAAFGVPVGFSDHTLGQPVPLAAVALGACIIEKHFTLDRKLPGPDHRASMEPEELKALVQDIRQVETALGHGRKEPTTSERDIAAVARRSWIANRDLVAGTVLTQNDIVLKRPGTGLPPALLPYLIGRTLCIDVSAGTILNLNMLTDSETIDRASS